MVTAKFSNNYYAVLNRIKRLPVMMNTYLKVFTKKDALSIIDEYQKGLIANDFGLKPLIEPSIQQKAAAGYSLPDSPLYGAGESLERTLYNGLEIVKKEKGWILRFSRKKHHKADLTINQLHQIHENGAIIMVTEKMRRFLHYIGIHLKGETIAIRIPPRQAFAKAIERYMKKKRKEENVPKVKKAISAFVNNNDEKQLKVLSKYSRREQEISTIATIGSEK